jgi:hypothetical protein
MNDESLIGIILVGFSCSSSNCLRVRSPPIEYIPLNEIECVNLRVNVGLDFGIPVVSSYIDDIV